jgi:glutathione S-transferase
MADLRIFSYQPNPRIWKATIAARLTGVDVEVRGVRSHELVDWLWDFDARPLTEEDRAGTDKLVRQGRTGFSGQLFKTDAFLKAHPFGTVPAAFSPDGEVGIFESNSIGRAVARLGRSGPALYGRDAYEAARIDSFLDVSLVFARDGQNYLLALSGNRIDPAIYESAKNAFEIYMTGMEYALAEDRAYFVGDDLTLSDICFVAEYCSFLREGVHHERLAAAGLPLIADDQAREKYPGALAHFERLCDHPAFAPDITPFMEKLEEKRQSR